MIAMGVVDKPSGARRKGKTSFNAGTGEGADSAGSREAVPAIAPAPAARVQMIGLWAGGRGHGDQPLGFPDPASLVDRSWEAARRGQITRYLRRGRRLATCMGSSFCRFKSCCHPERNTLGSSDLTDGQWAWPEGLWHYVENHSVRLPDAFVANAAAHEFKVPAVRRGTARVSVDETFWICWVAENTPPLPPHPSACSLADAQAVCAELSTKRWSASVEYEHDRWKIRSQKRGRAFEDFTGPISAHALRAYLLGFRPIERESALSLQQARAIAAEHSSNERVIRGLSATTGDDGQVWWGLIMRGERRPTTPFEALDLEAIEIPDTRCSFFLPSGWKVNVLEAMGEPAWRFFLQERHRQIGLLSTPRSPGVKR